MPATSLYLSENWETDPDNLMVGDSITRTLEIKALGLLGSALPPMGIDKIPGLKIYPDMPNVESQQHESGAQSIRQESIALVAVSQTEVTLPEVRIPWWDTLNDVERVAVIPAQTLNIVANPDVEVLTQTPNASTAPVTNNTVGPATPSPLVTELSTIEPHTATPQNNQFWYTIITLIMLGWVCTTLLLLKKRAVSTAPKEIFNAEPELPQLYKKLCEAIKKDDHEMPKHLIIWARKLSEAKRFNLHIQNLQDLEKLSEAIHIQAVAFEAQLYAKEAGNIDNTYDKGLLLQTIKALAKDDNNDTSTSPLRPMYP